MTYKEVLDDLIDIMKRHRMIVTWGYGNLTDLVTPFKKQNTTDPDTGVVYNIDYPYAFLQPTQHNLVTNASRYNFNLIMMEQCNDDPLSVIQAQSDCHQYIKDVLAEIYYNYGLKYDFTLNSSVIPFKEKYNDTVSGMTASISLEIRDGLDDCTAPFAPIIPEPLPSEFVLDVTSELNYIFKPDIEQGPIFFQNTILDTLNGMRTPSNIANWYTIEENGTWTFVLSGVVRRTTDTGVWPDSPNMINLLLTIDIDPDVTNWPVDAVIGVDYPFECRWTDIPLTVADGKMLWRMTNEPAVEDWGMILAGANLKATYIPTV